MPTTEMIVMVAMTAAVILGFIYLLRFFGTLIVHKTMRAAIEKDPEMAEPLLAKLAAPDPRRDDERLSVILAATGVAMVAASLVIGDPAWVRYGIAAALFPLVVGTALWLRRMAARRAERARGQ